MSLSRAFTTRRLRLSSDLGEGGTLPRRRNTTAKGPVLRHKISAPIQLIHTTNMLSYNAPDLPRASRSNSPNARFDDDSDTPTTESTPPTSPDSAPGERPSSPEPNHLTSYFKHPAKSMVASEEEPPKIPQRSPSHTKKNSFDAIARSRSVSRLSGTSDVSLWPKPAQTFSRSPSTSTRASSVSHTSSPLATKQTTSSPPATPGGVQQRTPSEGHPFGQELAKVSELAEEYNANSRLAPIDEEQQYLDARGLKKLTADDYLGAIQSISSTFFPEAAHAVQPSALWI
ncbi:hypothetical protein CDD83_9329 [Cordyceps sp. RAO-2017]|nr:hypothetical protein CDD83_9329 [Cordyceps sp. RAO-2017]